MADDSEEVGLPEVNLTDTVQTLDIRSDANETDARADDSSDLAQTLLPESPDRGNASATSSSALSSPSTKDTTSRRQSSGVKRGSILTDAKRMRDALSGTSQSLPGVDEYGHFTRMKMENALEATITKVNTIKKRLKAAAFDTSGGGGVNWNKLFAKYDKDSSGEVDFDEFRFAIRKDAKITPQMLNEEMLRTIFEFLDKDNSGSIHFEEEFIPWVESVEEGQQPRKKRGPLPDDRTNVLEEKARKRHLARLQGALQQTRDMIRLAKRGLRAASYSKGGVNWVKLFRQYDRDNSGNICFDEFRRALRKDAKLTKAMLSDEQVKMLFDFLDGDGGGEINFETEFLPWLEASEDDEDNMDEMFARQQNSRKSRVASKSIFSRQGSRPLSESIGSLGSTGGPNTELSNQISQLASLVKRQSKEIQRLQQTHSDELKRIRLEQDALCTLLDTSGTVPWQNLELEMQRHKPKPGAEASTPLKAESSGSPASGARQANTPSYGTPPRKLDLDEQEDLFEICLPLLQRMKNKKKAEPEVRWQFEFSLGWKDFSEVAYERIEKAHQKGEPKARIKIGKIPMVVYFDEMILKDHSGAQKDKKIQRIERRSKIKRSYDQSIQQLVDALRRGCSPDLWRGPGTPLFAAVESGNIQLVDILLNAHATVNVRNEQGVSPLHLASFRGEMDLCITLLDHLADPNIPDKYGQTPIYFSPIRMACELLFQRLADLTLLNSLGQSAFHLAAKTGYEDVLLWFALHLPRPIADLKDSEGFTAVDWARAVGVNPHVLKKMHRWEPSASKIEWTPMMKTSTAAPEEEDDDSDGKPSDEMMNQIRHKLRAAAHWRGGVDWQKLFDRYDRTGMGELTYAEFHDAIRDGAHVSETMMTDKALFRLFQTMDADDGGTINYVSEFLPWIEPNEADEESDEERIHVLDIQLIHEIKKRLKAAAFTNGIVSWKALFRYYDRDNSGEINFTEFKAAIRKSARIPPSMVTDDQIRSLFDYLDVDASGTVDYATEFLAWLQPDGEGEYEAEWRRRPDKRFEVERKEALKKAFDDHVAQTKRAIMSAVTDNGAVNLKKMWRIYDKKEMGKLGLEDFKNIIRKNARVKPQTLTDGHVQTLFKLVDKDRDGWIDYTTEFLPWLGVNPGEDEPGGYSFSVEAAERQRKRAARALVISKMTEIHEKLRTAAYDNGHANWKKLFRHYDRDDTGDMDFGEFSQLMRKRARITPQQLSDEHLQELFELVDKDSDGIIKYDTEFLPWLQVEEGMDEGPGSNAAGVRAAQRRKLKAAKKELNQNMNGILNKLRACAYDNAKGGQNWEKLFRYYDKDGSGEVDFQEFLSIIRIKARVKPQDVSDDALKALFDFVDADKGGTISYEDEFLPWLEPDED